MLVKIYAAMPACVYSGLNSYNGLWLDSDEDKNQPSWFENKAHVISTAGLIMIWLYNSKLGSF